jgi:hypothetical protein
MLSAIAQQDGDNGECARADLFKEFPDLMPPIPEGVYPARIIAAEPATSQAGNPMFVLRLAILPNQSAVKTWLVFSAKTSWLLARFADACQLVLPVPPLVPALEPEHCVGRYCYVRLVQDTYKGTTRSKVDRFLAKDEAIAENPTLRQVRLPAQLPLNIPEVVLSAPNGELPF